MFSLDQKTDAIRIRPYSGAVRAVCKYKQEHSRALLQNLIIAFMSQIPALIHKRNNMILTYNCVNCKNGNIVLPKTGKYFLNL